MTGIPSIGSFTTQPSGILVPAGPDVVQAAYVVLDTFRDTEDVTLPNHTPDRDAEGGGWIAGAGVWKIDNANKAKQTTGGAAATNAYIETNLSDCIIECVYKTGDGDDYGGLTFRVADDDDNLEFFINPAQDNTYVGTNIAGSRVTLDFTAMTLANETEYALKVVLNGTSIKAYVDGVLKVTTTSSVQLTSTMHGLWMWTTDAFSRWDSFKVSVL